MTHIEVSHLGCKPSKNANFKKWFTPKSHFFMQSVKSWVCSKSGQKIEFGKLIADAIITWLIQEVKISCKTCNQSNLRNRVRNHEKILSCDRARIRARSKYFSCTNRESFRDFEPSFGIWLYCLGKSSADFHCSRIYTNHGHILNCILYNMPYLLNFGILLKYSFSHLIILIHYCLVHTSQKTKFIFILISHFALNRRLFQVKMSSV